MNSPDAHELLTVANETLLSRVLPAVPKELEYEVRMIARAMSISARELRQEHRIEEAGRKALAGVLGSGSGALSGDAQRLQLSQQIRRGDYDQPGADQDAMISALRQTNIGQLQLSNPRLVGSLKGSE